MRARGATPPELTHDVIKADALQGRRARDGVVDPKAAVDPIAARDARAERDSLGNGLAHRTGDEEREGQASLAVAAPAVLAPVRDGRLEAVQQVAVRHVQLDGLEAEPHGPPDRIHEGAPHALDAVLVERGRNGPALVERERRRRDRLPGVLVGGEGGSSLPRPARRGLAAGMSDLDAEAGAGQGDRPGGGKHARHGALVGVRIKPRVAVRDAADALDGGGLHHDKPGARHGQGHEVLQMPVAHAAVIGRILAHGRDHDAVREPHRAEIERRKEPSHPKPMR